MAKVMLTTIMTALAGLVGYLVSDGFREKMAQRQRDKIADEVARGDEAAVNARIGRFRSFAPWVATRHRKRGIALTPRPSPLRSESTY